MHTYLVRIANPTWPTVVRLKADIYAHGDVYSHVGFYIRNEADEVEEVACFTNVELVVREDVQTHVSAEDLNWGEDGRLR